MKKKKLTVEQWIQVFMEIDREVVSQANSYEELAERLMAFGKIKCELK
jgi:hypothetical protein